MCPEPGMPQGGPVDIRPPHSTYPETPESPMGTLVEIQVHASIQKCS